jgi:hypothetical protein
MAIEIASFVGLAINVGRGARLDLPSPKMPARAPREGRRGRQGKREKSDRFWRLSLRKDLVGAKTRRLALPGPSRLPARGLARSVPGRAAAHKGRMSARAQRLPSPAPLSHR